MTSSDFSIPHSTTVVGLGQFVYANENRERSHRRARASRNSLRRGARRRRDFWQGRQDGADKISSSTRRYVPASLQTATGQTRTRDHDKPGEQSQCNNWQHQVTKQPTSSPLRPCKNTCPDRPTRTIGDRSWGIARCSNQAKL